MSHLVCEHVALDALLYLSEIQQGRSRVYEQTAR